jgi:hypothetical protein
MLKVEVAWQRKSEDLLLGSTSQNFIFGWPDFIFGCIGLMSVTFGTPSICYVVEGHVLEGHVLEGHVLEAPLL